MSEQPEPMDEAEKTGIIDAIFAVPLHRRIGLELVELDAEHAVARFVSGEETRADGPHLHGGVINMLLEVPAYLALVPHLNAGEAGASVDVHIALMRAVPLDVEVELRGRLVRRGRSIAFCEAEAWAEGRLCATAQITKAIVAPGF